MFGSLSRGNGLGLEELNKRSVLVEDIGLNTQLPRWHIFARGTSRRRRFLIALCSSIAFAVGLIWTASIQWKRAHPLPAPFYCSTWQSAKSIDPAFREGVLREYHQWSSYDLEMEPAELASPTAPLRQEMQNAPFASLDYEPRVWTKPKGFKTIAMIFFGRPHLVDILDCYLQQNMFYNGGYLDEVHFIAHTTDLGALEWLDNLVNVTEGYERIEVAPHCFEHPNSEDCRYERIWERYATDSDTLYIKIDDDMVYVHPETIPRLVEKRLEFPHPYAISANLINSPVTSWLHYHTGAIYPYLPEPFPLPGRIQGNTTWRPSELPLHPDDASYRDLHFEPTIDTALINSAIKSDKALYEQFHLPPFPGHRWLPLSQNSTSLLHTPMSRGTADPWGPSVHSWAIAAQQHYSLLQNIENGTLDRYWVAPVPPHGSGLWNMQYTRYNLNFIAVWGKDVATGAKVHRVSGPTAYTPEDPLWEHGLGTEWANGIVSDMHDDEKNITADMPRALGRPMMIDVQALAAHMHFHDQEVGMQMTDVLDRWRSYVNERVCPLGRMKRVPGQMSSNSIGWTSETGGWGWWRCPY